MIETCMICNIPEKNYKPDEGIEYVCGDCIQKILKFSQEELKRGRLLALEKGYERKGRPVVC